jgi:geranylgeranyl diphosphate synthase, type II
MTSISLQAFADSSRRLRSRIERALDRHTSLDADCPEPLRAAMRYSLLDSGKRLRPLLVLMAAKACGGDVSRALPAACAVEMVHTYSLIHDDLPAMDDDDMRRGRPSCHARFGEALAILAGDALLTLAFEVLARHVRPRDVAATCCAALARAAGPSALVGGQADDIASNASMGDLARLESIHRRKTGALFNVALRLGALVARATPKQTAALQEYGENLGLAFQIVDDVLDLRGDESSLGKRIGKDAERGKLTFPALLGVEESRRRARRLVEQACAVLPLFQHRGADLRALADYVLQRDC